MSMIIIIWVASVCGYICESISDFIKRLVETHRVTKMRGRRADRKTRIRYKLEDCWDFLITPR